MAGAAVGPTTGQRHVAGVAGGLAVLVAGVALSYAAKAALPVAIRGASGVPGADTVVTYPTSISEEMTDGGQLSAIEPRYACATCFDSVR